MVNRQARRIELINSLIRMETWMRDRVAGDVSRAEQLHVNCRNERDVAEQALNAALDVARSMYGHDSLLQIDGMERIRHYLAQADARHQETAHQEHQAEKLLGDLKNQLERQALKIRGLERAVGKQATRMAIEVTRHESRELDDLILINRESKHV